MKRRLGETFNIGGKTFQVFEVVSHINDKLIISDGERDIEMKIGGFKWTPKRRCWLSRVEEKLSLTFQNPEAS